MGWKTQHVKMAIAPKLICGIQLNSNQNHRRLFFLINELILKFILKCKQLRIAKTTWKKNKVGGITAAGFKIYKATVINSMTVRHSRKDRHIDPQNRIESSETDPHIYVQLIFEKLAKAIQ